MFKFEPEVLHRGHENSFVYERAVAFQDVDAAGIVFFARVFDYFHDSYAAWLAALGHPLPEVLHEQRWAAPLRHAEASYLRPLRYGDVLHVELGPVHVEKSDLTIAYRVRVSEVHAIGQTVHAFVDPKTFQRTAVPDDLRSHFEKLAEHS